MHQHISSYKARKIKSINGEREVINIVSHFNDGIIQKRTNATAMINIDYRVIEKNKNKFGCDCIFKDNCPLNKFFN